MILPADISLASSVVNSCSFQNIPLYYSGVEHRQSNPAQFRVKPPELLNINNLDYSGHMFAFLGSVCWKFLSESHLERNFDYDEVTIDFTGKIEIFEDSYLIGTADPICDPDD